ncbi:hypothetical protein BASA50_008235 [Batrachochytrium salamandrivorans]|uniref:Uncharacterized protein n=1 Tax=Batrachochytrium salamandrivorans TaxID=1357716 RepID=A0ABQ8F530_9FUNG|nr:hypothetical protein BASA62_004486 [Batrachochytrium salamandrivorans]KAH6592089.1 hypothetical protein BASA50_008235 [Batrachochytrium salamandrivorans]
MKTAAILVISLLAIIGGAAPAPALDDDNLQLYKRQAPPPPPPPAPPLPPNLAKSKPNDGVKNVKTTVHNRPAGGSGSSRVSQPNGQFQSMQMPKYSTPFDLMNQRKRPWDNGSNGGGSVNNNPNLNSVPKFRSQSKTPGKTTASVSSQQFKIVRTGTKGTPSPPPRPSWSPNFTKSKSNDGTKNVKTTVHNRPAGGSGSSRVSQPNGQSQSMQMPKYSTPFKSVNQRKMLWDNGSNGGGSVNNNPNPNSVPKSRFQPKTPGKTTASVSSQQSKIVHTGAKGTPPPLSPSPFKNRNYSPSDWKKTAGADGSKKSSSVATTSQTSSSAGGKSPNFDPSQVKLKPVMQKHRSEPPAFEPHLFQIQLRKTPRKTTASVSTQQFKIVRTGAKGTPSPPPRPSWSPNFTKSKSNDGVKNVKTTVHNRPAGGSGSSRVSQPNGQSQSMQMPKYSIPFDLVKQRKMLWDNGSNGGGSVNNNPNPNSVPKSRFQPKTPGKTTAPVSIQQSKIVGVGVKGIPPPPPRPSWSSNFAKSKSNDGVKNVKTTVHNRPAGGSGSSRVSQPNGQSQSMQMPKYSTPFKSVNQRKRPWDNGSNGGGSVNNNPNLNSVPKSRFQPKTPGKTTAPVSSQSSKIVHTGAKGIPLPLSPSPFKNRDHSPSNWKKTADVDGSKKSSSVATTSQTSSSAGGKSPNFDPSQVKLKPVMQKHRSEPPTPEPPSHKFQLRKAPYRDGPKGWNAHNSNTVKEQTKRDPSTSHQKKSSPAKTPPKVAPHPNPKALQEARRRAWI